LSVGNAIAQVALRLLSLATSAVAVPLNRTQLMIEASKLKNCRAASS
jgi:hypothetical protein